MNESTGSYDKTITSYKLSMWVGFKQKRKQGERLIFNIPKVQIRNTVFLLIFAFFLSLSLKLQIKV